jgi:hypothetical protein
MVRTQVDFVSVEGCDFSNTHLKCPLCGSDYIHMVYVKVQRKSDTTIVADSGTSMKASRNSGRGAILTLGYNAECGHAGALIFFFHEGLVYLDHKQLPENSELKDIWRD